MKLKLYTACLFALSLMLFGGRLAIAQQRDTVIVNADQGTVKISKYLYGQFMEDLGHGIYGGVWVGPNSDIPNIDGIRKDVVDALKKIDVPDVRWPGGCFADEYHWKDGIGPEKNRPKRVNLWGNVSDDNAFGTQEFLEFCKLIGAQPYIAGNVGSGTVREMKQWIEYLTYPGDSNLSELRRKNGHPAPWHIRFWGVGNESWGCGGSMTPEYYANQFKRYTTYLHNYGGNRLFEIASGPNGADYNWTRVLMKDVGRRMDGLSLHYYTVAGPDWGHKGSSTDFSEKLYFDALKKAERMNAIISRHSSIMDEYDPGKKVALVVDEWGIWTDPLPATNPAFLRQQNSMRDALVASRTLDIFNKHADRVRMANIAQMVNVLQAMILTKGKQMVLTPTYYVFQMYKNHQGATYLPLQIHSTDYSYKGEKIPAISATASKDSTGQIHITMSNVNPSNSQKVIIDMRGGDVHTLGEARILTAGSYTSVNTFDHPDAVKPAPFKKIELKNNKLTVVMPPHAIVSMTLR